MLTVPSATDTQFVLFPGHSLLVRGVCLRGTLEGGRADMTVKPKFFRCCGHKFVGAQIDIDARTNVWLKSVTRAQCHLANTSVATCVRLFLKSLVFCFLSQCLYGSLLI